MKLTRLAALLGLTLCILAGTLLIQPKTSGQDAPQELLRSALGRAQDAGLVAAEAPASPGPAPEGHALRPGARVRHPLFGVGTVLRSEGSGEDLKLTVSFAGVGAKKLVARYAGLVLV